MRISHDGDHGRMIASHGPDRAVVSLAGEEEVETTDVPDIDGHCPEQPRRVADPDAVTLPRGGVLVSGERRLSPGTTETATDPTVVCDGAVVCMATAEGETILSVDERGRATLRPSGDVTISWCRCRHDNDVPAMISPPSRDAEGAASVVEAVSARVVPNSTTPARTWPAARSPPPAVGADGTPADVIDGPETGICLRLPSDHGIDGVVSVASLAVYLGATVEVSDVDETMLIADRSEWSLGGDPETVDATSSRWLRRAFYLDSHARAGGPDGSRLRGHEAALSHVDATARELWEMPIAGRIPVYVAADSAVDDELPSWPEVAYIAPKVARLEEIARATGRLADVRRPKMTEMQMDDMVTQDRAREALRGASEPTGHDPPVRVAPEAVGDAGVVQWSAAGDPAGATAFSSESRRQHRGDGPLTVCVAECGHQSAEETRKRWETAVDGLAVNVSLVSNGVDALRRALANDDTDLLHVAGHDGGNGVECLDGRVCPSDIPDPVGPAVVVWSVCFSERFARETVAGGATAAVGTLGSVGRDDARRDAADLARLLSLGWSVERAVDVLRRTRDPLGWGVVGDGAARVGEPTPPAPPLVSVDSDSETVSVDHRGPDTPGAVVSDVIDPEPRLAGKATYELTDGVKRRLADRLDSPAVVDEDLVYPSEL